MWQLLFWKKPHKAERVNKGGTKGFYRVRVRLECYFVGEAIVEV